MVQRDGNFECDKDSKKRIMENLKKYYEDNSNYTFNYWIDPNPQAGIDCTATAYTQDNQVRMTYAIECKQRDCNSYHYSTALCEKKKYNDLTKAQQQRRYVANEYLDNTLFIWNINNIDENNTCWKKIARTSKGTTQQQQEVVWQERINMEWDKSLRIK